MKGQIAVHPDVTPVDMETVKALLAGIIGQVPLMVAPCQYHGQRAVMLATAGQGFQTPEGQIALVPLAILFDPDRDGGALLSDEGNLGVHSDGTPYAPKRQAHDGVPLRTGQYL